MRNITILAFLATLSSSGFAVGWCARANAAAPVVIGQPHGRGCDVYEVTRNANGDAIADMLGDAAQRVQTSACVRIVTVEGGR